MMFPQGPAARGGPAANAADARPTVRVTPVLRGDNDSAERLRAAPGAASAAPAHGANRRNLVITFLPVALLALCCFLSFVARTASPRLLGRQSFGNTSRVEATTIASSVLRRMTGEQPEALDVTTQTAYAYRRGETVREWNVLCETGDGKYLMRLNADTGTVYAVNRLTGGGGRAVLDPEAAAIPQSAAESRARAYLGMIGVPSRELILVSDARLVPDPGHPARRRVAGEGGGAPDPLDTGLYNFTYRRRVPGLGARLLKVSVSRKDASLEHIWNPVSAL